MVNDIEIWKDVVGYEGLYKVSNSGRIKSLDRLVVTKKNVNINIPEKIRKQCDNGFGYLYVTLTKNGKSLTQASHRIVAKAFIPNTENKKCINHKNWNRSDNRVDNLEWTTYMENSCSKSNRTQYSSQYAGVSYSKRDKMYIAKVSIKGKYVFQKGFKKDIDAYNARIEYMTKNNLKNH
jgi:hypothetical protein